MTPCHHQAQCILEALTRTDRCEDRKIVVADAIDLLRKGDAESHNRLVAARAPELAQCDAIMLAHFSTSRAALAVRARVATPVLTAPHAAVERMRAMVEGASPG